MNELASTLFIAAIAVYIIIFLLGIADKIVIYYNKTDLAISLLPWVFFIATFILLGINQPKGQKFYFNAMNSTQTLIFYFGIAATLIFAIWTIHSGIKYNRSFFIGFFVGIFKLVSALLGTLIIINQVLVISNKNADRKQFLIAALIFGLAFWLGGKMINGERVYLERGWY